MKKLIFSILLLGAITTKAQKIEPVQIGIGKVADSISVSVITFKTTDKTCQLYYQVFDVEKKQIDEGNLSLTEKEFAQWGETNKYIEDLALVKLKLKRKIVKSASTSYYNIIIQDGDIAIKEKTDGTIEIIGNSQEAIKMLLENVKNYGYSSYKNNIAIAPYVHSESNVTTKIK